MMYRTQEDNICNISWTMRVLFFTLMVLSNLSEAFLSLPLNSIHNKHVLQSNSQHSMVANNQNVVVISPPGGVGEVAAVQAAKMGSSVKWFVVSPQSSSSGAVSLSAETLESIEGKGSLELAGANAETMLLPADDASSALKAVSTWCSNADSIICTIDGIEESVMKAARAPGVSAKQMEETELIKMNYVVLDAIKVAAKEACTSTSSMKIAVIPADMDMASNSKKQGDDDDDDEDNKSNALTSFFGGNKVKVPKSLSKAMSSNGSKNFAIIRYGELFGIPESSVSHINNPFG